MNKKTVTIIVGAIAVIAVIMMIVSIHGQNKTDSTPHQTTSNVRTGQVKSNGSGNTFKAKSSDTKSNDSNNSSNQSDSQSSSSSNDSSNQQRDPTMDSSNDSDDSNNSDNNSDSNTEPHLNKNGLAYAGNHGSRDPNAPKSYSGTETG